MTKSTSSLGLLSKYRNEIFGISTISIVILHFALDYSDKYDTGILSWLAKIYVMLVGSIGVEVFIFLSGMGLFYSMSKGCTILDFYSRRIVRVLIPYAIWGSVYWIICDFIVLNKSISEFFSDLFLISLWTKGNTQSWFIGFIILMYLLFPLFYKLLKKDNMYRMINFIILLFISLSISTRISYINPDLYKSIDIVINRVPIFLIG